MPRAVKELRAWCSCGFKVDGETVMRQLRKALGSGPLDLTVSPSMEMVAGAIAGNFVTHSHGRDGHVLQLQLAAFDNQAPPGTTHRPDGEEPDNLKPLGGGD